MKNFKIDISNHPQQELQLFGKNGSYNTWRVYFDGFEHEDEHHEETVTYTEIEEIEVEVVNPETGEVETQIKEVEVEKTMTVVTEVWEHKYVEVTRHISENPTAVELIRDLVLQEIDAYDVSPEVNSFYLNGQPLWLDKDTRVGLMNSTTIQKAAGMEETVLWLGTIPFKINCDLAIQMLGGLEIYALDCFNKTAEHKRNVSLLETINDLVEYDYTKDYPKKLEFNL